MTDSYAFTPPPVSSVAIAGESTRFPVRRIFCVGRNYAAHAREMGKDPDREVPFFFTKPADAVVDSGSTIAFPRLTSNLHHEIELVVAISKDGAAISRSNALDHVYGYGVGIDLTRRDLQQEAKDKRRPWDWAKAFDQSAPCGPVLPVEKSGHPDDARIWLTVNDEVRQDASISELIWSVPEIISILSDAMQLCTGDLIYTGTPAGVGAIQPGDLVKGGIDGIGKVEFKLGEAA